MPIKIPKDLPAYASLTDENVFVMSEDRAGHQDIRPLKVGIVNLMPTTIDTEIQLLRLLGNTPLQVDIVFLRMGTHESHNAPPGHLEKFYMPSRNALKGRFDGLIITGAPVETLRFEEVDYWKELCDIMEFSKHNVFSTMHICWGSQAGLYYHYGIPKVTLNAKFFGVFTHNINERRSPLFRGFDDIFPAPQSRHTESSPAAVAKRPELTVQSATPCGSPFIVTAHDGREIYVSGHLEYDIMTLDKEYRRDIALGKSPAIPANYYAGNNPDNSPVVRWRAHAYLFFSNWINYIYQETPFDLDMLE